MELRAYLNMLWQERATVIICTLTALIAAYLFTLSQPEIYEATASFVMRPRAALVEDQQDSVRVLDTLGRQLSIGSTYVQVASSRLIRQRAIESLKLPPEQRADLAVDGEVVAGTNMLKFSVQGRDPVVVQQFANQIGIETVAYVGNLYEIFELEPLDTAVVPRKPIKPSLVLNLALGMFLGLSLGVGIALFTVYWRSSPTSTHHFDIVDHTTGAYNLPYFRLRLRQEVSRALRTRGLLSIALVQISSLGSHLTADTLRQAAILLHAELNDEEILAYAGDAVFALMLVEMSGEAAKAHVEELCSSLQIAILHHSKEARLWDIKCSAGVSSIDDADSTADDLWSQCVQALTDVNSAENGKVSLYSQLEGIFAPAQPIRRGS